MGTALLTDHADPYGAEAVARLRAFFATQRTQMAELAALSEAERARLHADADAQAEDKRRHIAKALALLAQVAPNPERNAAE